MKFAIIFALAGTSVASMSSSHIFTPTLLTYPVPFGNAINAIYGGNLDTRHAAYVPSGSSHHHHHHRPTGVRPTGVRPTGAHPTGVRPSERPSSKKLAIDYGLAPVAVAKYKVQDDRVDSYSEELPPFTPVSPSAPVPTATSSGAVGPTAPYEPSLPTPSSGFAHPTGGVPRPTGGFPHPTGGAPYPTAGFPGTGVGSLPTTLATYTRGPRPTSPPSPDDDEDKPQPWLEWLGGYYGTPTSDTY